MNSSSKNKEIEQRMLQLLRKHTSSKNKKGTEELKNLFRSELERSLNNGVRSKS